MKALCKKISGILKTVFGFGIALCLFAGGLTFFGYLAALCIGGEAATTICDFLYSAVLPIIVKSATLLVLLGLLAMYLAGETALTAGKRKTSQNKNPS